MKNQSRTSLDGSKVAETKISKKVHSRNIRQKRILLASSSTPGFNKKYCPECGFRTRGSKHTEGTHHNGSAVPCHRGR